jgi:hypothetical protein
MEHIDVRGLPESIAQALKSMVDALRRQMGPKPQTGGAAAAKLPLEHRPGKVIGPLTREELYDDAA